MDAREWFIPAVAEMASTAYYTEGEPYIGIQFANTSRIKSLTHLWRASD
jgi:hypothetical protein